MSLFSRKQKSSVKEKTWKRNNPRMYSGVPKRDKAEKKRGFSRFLFWLLSLVFLGVCVYLLFISVLLEVENVSVEGNVNIPSEDIASLVKKTMEGKYQNILSKKNFFFINKGEISSALRGNFDRLEVTSVENKFPKALLIKVKERQPELVWCSSGVCYLIDKEGLAFSGATVSDSELQNENKFLTVIDNNARPVEIGKTIINQDFMRYLKEMDTVLLDDLKLETEGNYHTPALASQEIMIKIKEGWMLKLNNLVDPADTKKILQSLFDKDLDTEKRQNLDYLDLSVRNKVYYKMK